MQIRARDEKICERGIIIMCWYRKHARSLCLFLLILWYICSLNSYVSTFYPQLFVNVLELFVHVYLYLIYCVLYVYVCCLCLVFGLFVSTCLCVFSNRNTKMKTIEWVYIYWKTNYSRVIGATHVENLTWKAKKI